MLRPVRTAGGQRRYSEMDVQRVEWLRDRIRDGWRIGEAARVIDEAASVALDEPADLRDTLIAAIEENDPRTVSATLDQAFAVLPLEQALAEVVTPALQWAGDAWHRGELSVAQEHAITAKVRAHLGKLISEGQGGVRGSAVLACAPGEHHDIGLLMLAVMLRADGWRSSSSAPIHPSTPRWRSPSGSGPAMLCLSASRTESVDVLRDGARRRRALGPDGDRGRRGRDDPRDRR